MLHALLRLQVDGSGQVNQSQRAGTDLRALLADDGVSGGA